MLDPEVATLRHALRTAHREGAGRGYPKTLRERVVAYAERAAAAGRPRADVAEAYASGLGRLARREGRAQARPGNGTDSTRPGILDADSGRPPGR